MIGCICFYIKSELWCQIMSRSHLANNSGTNGSVFMNVGCFPDLILSTSSVHPAFFYLQMIQYTHYIAFYAVCHVWILFILLGILSLKWPNKSLIYYAIMSMVVSALCMFCGYVINTLWCRVIYLPIVWWVSLLPNDSEIIPKDVGL